MDEPVILTPDAILEPDGEPPTPPMVPCEINLLSGKVFVVPVIDAWMYVPQGIFATGYWKGRGAQVERDVLISGDRVEYIELDYSAIKLQQAASD